MRNGSGGEEEDGERGCVRNDAGGEEEEGEMRGVRNGSGGEEVEGERTGVWNGSGGEVAAAKRCAGPPADARLPLPRRRQLHLRGFPSPPLQRKTTRAGP